MKLLFLVLFFLFYFSAQLQAQNTQKEFLQLPQKVSLQLQWKHQFENAGFYAAIEQGYYEEEGLEVELREIQPTLIPVQEVIEQRATFGLTYSSLVADYLQGKPVVMLANIFKHSALVLISQKELNLPSDLVGKRVMGSKTELQNSGITLMFHKFNMSTDDIVAIEPTYAIDDFVNKKVDAMTAFITNQPYLLNKKKIKYTLHNPTNYGSQFYDVNLFTSKEELQNNPKRVEAFTRASIKGWTYALEHSNEIIELILKKYNTQNKSKEALLYEAEMTKSLILPNIYKIGSINCDILQDMANNFIHLGLIPDNHDVNFKNFTLHDICKSDEISQFTKEEKKYLKQKKELKVCVDPNWMPFEGIKNGLHIGMSSDYMRIIESKIQIPITLVPTQSWNESLKFAKSGMCDILPLVMNTPQRQEYFNVTKPYLISSLVIATSNDKFFIADIADVLDKKFAVVKGYAFIEVLKMKYPSIKLVEVENISEGLEEVSKGNIYGLIDNLTTIGYLIQKKYLGTLKIAGKIDQTWGLGAGVKKDNLVLLSILDKTIDTIDEKQKQTILNQWTSINYDRGYDYTLLWQIFGALCLIFLFILYRYRLIVQYNKKIKRYLSVINKNILMLSIDLHGIVTDVSEAFCETTDYSKNEIIGHKYNLLQSDNKTDVLFKKMHKAVRNGESWHGEVRNKKKDGSFYWADIVISAIFNPSGSIEGYHVIQHDITDKKRIEELSVTDQLTQISNRLHLENSFDIESKRAKRYNKIYSVIILDIDFFKAINDEHGHLVGDTVLVNIAKILSQNIRDTDVIGRWGGEEFLIICPLTAANIAKGIAEKLRKKIEAFDFCKAGKVTCSFGISEFKLEDKDKNEVIKRADTALYIAKEKGRNKVVVLTN
ncbi:diguanylate cyclase [bacterium]|nr:diguanylate cyclase [bacterium]MBU1994897.1 diguanylate cyclase [bacterium]